MKNVQIPAVDSDAWKRAAASVEGDPVFMAEERFLKTHPEFRGYVDPLYLALHHLDSSSVFRDQSLEDEYEHIFKRRCLHCTATVKGYISDILSYLERDDARYVSGQKILDELKFG